MVGHMSQCDIAESVGRRAYIKGRLDYYKVHYYSQLQSVPECVKKFVYPEYFELESEYSSAGTVSAIVAALVALLVVLL